jgi:hypothetical protein
MELHPEGDVTQSLDQVHVCWPNTFGQLRSLSTLIQFDPNYFTDLGTRKWKT